MPACAKRPLLLLAAVLLAASCSSPTKKMVVQDTGPDETAVDLVGDVVPDPGVAPADLDASPAPDELSETADTKEVGPDLADTSDAQDLMDLEAELPPLPDIVEAEETIDIVDLLETVDLVDAMDLQDMSGEETEDSADTWEPDALPDLYDITDSYDGWGEADGDVWEEDGGDVSGEYDAGDVEPPPPCEEQTGADDHLVLLAGQVLSHDLYLPSGHVLIDRETQKLTCVAENCFPELDGMDPTIICTDGIIMPGMIDSHNHVHYNHLPVWQHSQKFNNRYQWQANSGYKDFKKPHTMLSNAYKCEMTKWGELRSLIGGSTATTGSPGGANCINVLIRNTEEGADSLGLPGENGIECHVTDISGYSENDAEWLLGAFAAGTMEAFIPHIAEGIDESSRAEFDQLTELGLMVPQTSIVHGVAATTFELAQMAANYTQLIWSPQSNVDLYGLTARVTTAINLGVLVTVGPDWTPSGTMNLLYELECVDHLNEVYFGGFLTPEYMVDMVTFNPAMALHLEDKIGVLKAGWYADVTVLDKLGDDPHRNVIEARPENVQLVFVGGKPLYGDAAAMALMEPEYCEPLDVCGRDKTICVKDVESDAPDANQTLADLEAILVEAKLEAKAEWTADNPGKPTYQFDLFPLFYCDQEVHWCEMGNDEVSGVPSDDDSDGDDVMNEDDNCPDIFNPEQGDGDVDEVGDACDPCPLDPDTEECEAIDPLDLDGDGFSSLEDNCPQAHNPEQEDGDQDGKGDLCDACPDFPNPDAMGCPTSIFEITDEQHPLHPDEGAAVLLADVVVTAVAYKPYSSVNGFWVQDTAGGPNSGIFVFMGGNTPPPAELQAGQIVSVTGAYVEYYGMAELQNPEVWIVDADPVHMPEPVLSNPGLLCTGSPDAEQWEGVFVRIENVGVTTQNPDDPKDYDEFEVGGCYRVDDYIYQDLVKPTVGIQFEYIEGIHSYSFDNYKIWPRGPDDVQTN